MIAQQDDLRLVPKDVSWTQFCEFVSEAVSIQNRGVSGRYCCGELRLSRPTLPFLHKSYFEQAHGQYGDYFARLYGPVLFIFTVVSAILNSTQAEIAVEQVSAGHWEALWAISGWLSTIRLIGAALISLCFFLLWLWMTVDEWLYTAGCLLRRRGET